MQATPRNQTKPTSPSFFFFCFFLCSWCPTPTSIHNHSKDGYYLCAWTNFMNTLLKAPSHLPKHIAKPKSLHVLFTPKHQLQHQPLHVLSLAPRLCHQPLTNTTTFMNLIAPHSLVVLMSLLGVGVPSSLVAPPWRLK